MASLWEWCCCCFGQRRSFVEERARPNVPHDFKMAHIQYLGETLPLPPFLLAFHLVLPKCHIYHDFKIDNGSESDDTDGGSAGRAGSN